MLARGAALLLTAVGIAAGDLPGSGAAEGASPPRRHEVAIRGFEYGPPRLVAAVGDTVVWRNQDLVPHTVTAKGIDSGSVGPGGSWSLVPGRRGTYRYLCDFHPGMRGTLVVR